MLIKVALVLLLSVEIESCGGGGGGGGGGAVFHRALKETGKAIEGLGTI
jgi:hypothetical protein